MPKESTKATITTFAGTPLVRVVDGANSRNISPANLVAESGAQAALDGRYQLLEPIAEYDISTNISTVTFSAIPATFRHLRIVGFAKVGTGLQDLNMQFNGDTTANYDWQRLLVSNTTVSGFNSMGATSMNLGAIGTVAGTIEVLIPDYLSGEQKAIRSESTSKAGTSAGNLSIRNTAGFWRDTAAITSITISSGSGGFLSGSHFTLYGEGPNPT